MGVKCREADTPRDADDFSRCYDLYKFCELTPADLQKVANRYPYWRPIIDQWDELCEMYAAQNYSGVNERLKAMFDVKKTDKENQNLCRDRHNSHEEHRR